jgi:HEAT repeat protein
MSEEATSAGAGSPGREPAPGPDGAIQAEETTSALRQFVGLFIVPLLVVVMCVGVFVLFGWVAYDRQTVGDYLNDLRDNRSFFAHRRKQAAYELSKILSADPEALLEEAGAGEELRSLFEGTDDLWVRRYLALVLGHIEDRDAVPLLIAAATGDDPQTRIYSLWSLGAIGDETALEVVRNAASDDDAGIRKTAAFALGGFDSPEGIGSLEVLVEDPVADVRWNAAVALAARGSDRGVAVLEQMLDRRLLAQIPDITPQQQEEAMIEALRALGQLDQEQNLALVESLAESDPSLKVRQAAIEVRRSLRDEG